MDKEYKVRKSLILYVVSIYNIYDIGLISLILNINEKDISNDIKIIIEDLRIKYYTDIANHISKLVKVETK